MILRVILMEKTLESRVSMRDNVKFKSLVKWTGSKRVQSFDILEYFPSSIDTYYEPFLGGANVLRQLLQTSIKVNKFVCSDINKELIEIWDLTRNNPDKLLDGYFKLWEEYNSLSYDDKYQFFLKVRDDFNKTRSAEGLMFLSRTSINGLIRYNSKGEFNASCNPSRACIQPNVLAQLINDWNYLLNTFDVSFICQDYSCISPTESDFLYLDPPYANLSGLYFGNISLDKFWDWMRNLPCRYLLSFDGITGDKDMTYNVPTDLYTKHIYLDNGLSGFNLIGKNHSKQKILESLYIK
jgi:DNA adenine methylase